MIFIISGYRLYFFRVKKQLDSVDVLKMGIKGEIIFIKL